MTDNTTADGAPVWVRTCHHAGCVLTGEHTHGTGPAAAEHSATVTEDADAASLALSRATEAASAPASAGAAGALRWWRNPRTGNYVATGRGGRVYLAGSLDRRLARPWFLESWPDGQPGAAAVSYGYKRLRDAQAAAAEDEAGHE
jgi:hypothetical protein